VLEEHKEQLRRWRHLNVLFQKELGHDALSRDIDDDPILREKLGKIVVQIAEVEIDESGSSKALMIRAQNEVLEQDDASWRVSQSATHRMLAQLIDLDRETQLTRVDVKKRSSLEVETAAAAPA
jgi:hypothetical protein